MSTIQLSATPTPKGNGYQATVTFPDGVSISSAETYPTIAEAMIAAAARHASAAGSTRSTAKLGGGPLGTRALKLTGLFDR